MGHREEPVPRDGHALVEVSDLLVHFPVGKGLLGKRTAKSLRAVDGVSFSVYEGEALGLVGESGCGKSTIGRAILQLHRPTGGTVSFRGSDLAKLGDSQLRVMRQQLQMIFQDPYGSLDPRATVGTIVGEPLRIQRLTSRRQRRQRVQELLAAVGLSPYFVNRYPHEFSGGQRQRIGIARALAVDPSFIVCDEPLSALDVSVQAQIVTLLMRLQEQYRLTYLFISHDLSVVRYIADRVAVMYLGKVVELAVTQDLYGRALHPYTQALISAVPVPDPSVEQKRERILLSGDVPSAVDPPSGCRFRTRCRFAQEVCAEEEPLMRTAGTGHYVACHFWEEIQERMAGEAGPI